MRIAFALAPVLLALPLANAQASTLTLRATGEALATQGFQAPELTRDGWALRFTSVIATFGAVTAWQTDPPFAADGPDIRGQALAFDGTFTVDLAQAGADGTVELASLPAAPGHYNALSWALLPNPAGAQAGFSLVLEGVASKDGASVPFVLRSRDPVRHACGEYIGDARKGFVTESLSGDLEITLHLDHLFGRADLGADNAMNRAAPGFDAFSAGGTHEISLAGVHLGHVGEGHCHDTPG